jgi:hypothetical protein
VSGLGEGFADGALRFSPVRGRMGTNYSLQYPSPFFDIAQTYLPATVKQMFRWCRYYYLVNPLINAVVSKMAEYPVTDVLLDSEDAGTKELWAHMLMEHLRYRAFQVEIGLDYYAYGNGLVSIYFPFVKMIECRSCGFKKQARDAEYAFRNYEFIWNCPKCGHHGPAKPFDHYVKAPRGIRLLRWNPEDIDVRYNDLNGQNQYYYEIPVPLKSDITMGKKSVIETVPQLFIEALRQKKAVVFSKDNLFHLKRPSLAGKDRGWGTPMILPVLKDTFYLQVMRKAQECVSLSSLLETSTGLHFADDVSVGDVVRTHTGNWKTVEKKWYRDAREEEIGRKITITGLRSFPTTYSPQHPVFTLRRTDENRRSDTKDVQRSSVILRNPHLYEEVLCPAEQLQVGQYVLYPRYLPCRESTIDVAERTGLVSTNDWVYSGCGEGTATAFESLERGEHVAHDNAGRAAKRNIKEDRTPKRFPSKINMTPEIAYILGWYAGDGSCGSRHVCFSLGKKDNPTPLMQAIRLVFDVEPTIELGASVDTVVLSDVIARKLIKGLIPGTARFKKAPLEVLNGTDQIKLSYLKGLWEADGCGKQGQLRGMLVTTSIDQAYDAYRILLHLGCIATIGKRRPRTGHINGQIIRSGRSYSVAVCNASFDRLRALWECGSGPEVISGKSGFFWKEYFATRVCAIEEVEEQQYIDFKVEGDSTFCTPGTATKNSILLEHIVPLRIMFPQAGSNTSDPYTSTNLLEWRDKVSLEIRKWRVDQNYIPIMPLPIGTQTIGGDGRALLLTQEMRVWSEQIVAGMGIPNELIFGGMSYSGSNVSLRMLENMFLGYLQDHLALLKWVIRSVADYLNWPMVGARFKPFKMADDLQRKAYLFQLNQAGKLSDESLLADADFESSREDKHIRRETDRRADANRKMAVAQAEVQGEAQMIQMRWQMKAQTEQMKMQTALQLSAAQQQAATQVGAQNYMMQAQSAMQQGQPPPTPPPELTPQPQEPLQLPHDVQSPLTVQSIQPIPPTATGESLSQQVNVDVLALAQQAAGYIKGLDPISQARALSHLKQTQPELHHAVYRLMTTSNPVEGPEQSSRPLPQERAPRRGPQNALI